MRSALVPILLADPMPWAFKAPYAWDFLKDRARFAGGYKGALANTPGWTATPATHSAGGVLYASTASGALQSFASGTLRRTDKGVLIEGARTNLCLQSQTFDNASWTKTNCTVTADAIAAPDGTMTADKLVSAASTSQQRVHQVVTLSAATAYTFSVFAKAGEATELAIRLAEDTVPTAWFNLSSGITETKEAGWTSSGIQALANGWYRCWATHTTIGTSYTYRVYVTNTNGDITFNGDGSKGLYLWGAQLE